ncbi:MAG: transposase family protein, partial [Myxococcales bacterium]|nr:transposase family protein [Myxococcales bacterium]
RRYGKANEHNALVPRDHWLLDDERKAIIAFHDKYPLEGYRRLAFMMIDQDVAAASPSSVYRVLAAAGLLDRWNRRPSKKGTGFVQPLKPHEHWHIDVAYLNLGGTFYYLCSILDGASRSILHWEIREAMTEADVECILERARDKHPGERPRIISDNGPQFIAKDFKEFIRLTGMTHVRTALLPAVERQDRTLAQDHQVRRDSTRPAKHARGGPRARRSLRRALQQRSSSQRYRLRRSCRLPRWPSRPHPRRAGPEARGSPRRPTRTPRRAGAGGRMTTRPPLGAALARGTPTRSRGCARRDERRAITVQVRITRTPPSRSRRTSTKGPRGTQREPEGPRRTRWSNPDLQDQAGICDNAGPSPALAAIAQPSPPPPRARSGALQSPLLLLVLLVLLVLQGPSRPSGSASVALAPT